MAEGAEKLNQLAEDLSTTADQELTTFKKKAGDHLEERIQLATRPAHAEADIHATRLRNDTENQINKHLQRLIGEAKAEATDFAVAEVKTSLDRADQHIVSKTDGAITTMMTHFNTDASDRVAKLVKESLSTVRTTLQTFADDHIVAMHRRADVDVDRVFREVRKKEERAAVALIKPHAMEEKRLISTAIEEKIDAVFNEARDKQKRALSQLDERADAHSTAVHQAIQRHVKRAWLSSESVIKDSINAKVDLSLKKHSQELMEYVDRKGKEEAQDLSARVENALKSYVVGEIKAQGERQKQSMVEAVDRALINIDDRIKTGVSTATTASNAASDTKIIDIENRLNAVPRDVQDAVRDLDDKIALVSSTVASSSSGTSVASPQEHLDKGPAIDVAMPSLNMKIEAEVIRALSIVDSQSAIPAIVRREIVTAMGDVEAALRDQLDAIETILKTDKAENRKLRDELALLKDSHDDLLRRVNAIDEKVAAQSRQDRIQADTRSRATGMVMSEHPAPARTPESGTHRIAMETEDPSGARYSTPVRGPRGFETGNQPGYQHTARRVAADSCQQPMDRGCPSINSEHADLVRGLGL